MAHTPKPIRKKLKAARGRGTMIFFGTGAGKTELPASGTLIDLGKLTNSFAPVYIDPFRLRQKHPESSSKTVLGLTDSLISESEQ